jgi:hypothetical protein
MDAGTGAALWRVAESAGSGSRPAPPVGRRLTGTRSPPCAGTPLARVVRAWTAARITRAGRFRSVRPLTCPPRRNLAVPRTRLARSVRACLPGTVTVLGCFRAIRVLAGPGIRICGVRLAARAVATTGIGSELPRTGLPRPVLARTGLPWPERPWSGLSRSGWSRPELLRAGRASPVLVRSVVAWPVPVRPVLACAGLAWAGLARMLFPTLPAPAVLRFAGAVGLPLSPSAWSVPGAFPSGPSGPPRGLARWPATGIRPVGRGAVEPV